MAPHAAETWMFPVLDLFSADLGFSILRYRLQRLPAAQARATQFGIPGAAMFPWTSTQSGYGTTHVQLNSTCDVLYDQYMSSIGNISQTLFQ